MRINHAVSANDVFVFSGVTIHVPQSHLLKSHKRLSSTERTKTSVILGQGNYVNPNGDIHYPQVDAEWDIQLTWFYRIRSSAINRIQAVMESCLAKKPHI